MSRSNNASPLSEKGAPGTNGSADIRLRGIDAASKNAGERRPSTANSGVSFLTLLLRALSAWPT
jgi:hypothetical protein